MQRIITSIQVAADGVAIDFVARDHIREGGILASSLQIPGDGELADRIDRLMMDAETLLDLALESFRSTDVAGDGDFTLGELEEAPDEPGLEHQWDNPDEREGACRCSDPLFSEPDCPIHGHYDYDGQ